MKQFFRKIAAIALCAATAFGMTACGGPQGSGSQSGDGKTLTYAVWGSSDELALIDQIVDGFEALYAEEGYKVKLEHYSNDYYKNLQLAFSGKREADVFWMQGGTIESYIRHGLLQNLQPLIEAEYDDGISFTEQDLWSINDGYRYDAEKEQMGSGDLYAVVKDWSPDFAMVYNKTLIDQFDSETAPYTSAVKKTAEDKLAAIAADDAQYASLRGTKVVGRTLAEIVGYPTDESGKYPSETVPMSWQQSELMCFLLSTYSSDNIRQIYGTILDNDALKFAQMQAEMNGALLYSEDGKSFNYSTSGTQDERLAEAYQHFINYQRGALASTGVFGTSSVSSDADFPKGNVAVVWYGRWKFAKPSWETVNFGLAPPPTKEGGADADGGGVYCSSVAVGLAVSARTGNAELAWKFIRYYMTAGTTITLGKGFNLPGNRTIATSEEFLKGSDERTAKLNNWYIWLAENTHPFTFTKYIDNSVADGYLKTYLASAAKGERSVEEALRQAGNRINSEIATALI